VIPVSDESNGFEISSNSANGSDLETVADVIEAQFG
jgi:hypothetical protein